MTTAGATSPGLLWTVVDQKASSSSGGQRVAVCHDWLTTLGGADKVAALLSRHFSADLFAAFALRSELADDLEIRGTRVGSRLNGWASSGRNWPYLLPVMPVFWRTLDLSDYDVVLTSSHATVNAIRAPQALRVSYCHTPMRYAWDWRQERERLPRPAQALLPVAAAALRAMDRRWATDVDAYVANSSFVADRIRAAYGREATVVHPPIDTDLWCLGEEARQEYFLVAGRAVAYKRPMAAVEAARRAGMPVVVAGGGPLLPAIEHLDDPGITVVRSPTDVELRRLYRSARALIFAGVEDFGMTLLEAQACGTPVIAQGAGGALESVIHGVTGVLVDDSSVDALADAIRSFDDAAFDRVEIRHHAEGFGTARFLAEMDDVISSQLRSRALRGGSAGLSGGGV